MKEKDCYIKYAVALFIVKMVATIFVQGGGYKLCYTALDVLQPLISVLENYIR
jgi:hypothetical protein